MPRGPVPKPADQRRGRRPVAHEWQFAAGAGWRHGDTPKPPGRLTKAAREAWSTWFDSWFAWFWEPEDVPGLRQMVRLYNEVERGEFQRHAELRLVMDNYGVTPKGRQDRRWRPMPLEQENAGGELAAVITSDRWSNLEVADG